MRELNMSTHYVIASQNCVSVTFNLFHKNPDTNNMLGQIYFNFFCNSIVNGASFDSFWHYCQQL